MDQNKMYGSRIPRAPKRALKTLSQNEVNNATKDGAGGNVVESKLKKPRLAPNSNDQAKEAKATAAAAGAATAPGVDSEWLEISEKNNNLTIDALLAMKMTGKGKWDHKGRCEQMMPYIRQLRACTRYLRSCVNQSDAAKAALVADHESSLASREADLKNLKRMLEDLTTAAESSAKEIAQAKAEASDLKESCEAKQALAMDQKVEISTLKNDLVHQKNVVSEKSQEILKLQDNYVKSQEYAQNLQDFVQKLKEDTEKMNETLLRIQEERSDLVSELNVAKGNLSQQEEKIQTSKRLIEDLQSQKKALDETLVQVKRDHQGKVEEMSATHKRLQTELEEQQKMLSQEREARARDAERLASEIDAKDTALAQAKMKQEQTDAELTETRARAAEVETNLGTTMADLKTKAAECEALTSDLTQAKTELQRYNDITGRSACEMETLMEKSKNLQDQNASQTEVLEAVQTEYNLLKQKLAIFEEKNGTVQEQHAAAQREIAEKNAMLREMEARVHEGEELRKKLHNQILELKGNIRVFCRTRPLPGSEEEDMDVDTAEEEGAMAATISYTSQGEKAGKGLQLRVPSAPTGGSKRRGSTGEPAKDHQTYNFDFDRSFKEGASQEEVFEEISQLVQSALDGYKVCIFAYGQTGSGKTHTMIGNNEQPGMIPRSLEQIFKCSEKMKEQGWTYSISVSMLEIYNEEYKDLLGKKKVPAGKQHTVKHDQQGRTTITYMTEVKVNSEEKVNSLLNKAMSVRSVAATQCNDNSSRSHFVFRLNIDGSNKQLGQSVCGVLNLVDLAGSERLSKSKATGDRLKETQNINKSLSALGDVIMAINNGDAHVPYRNSKLTYLLQPCLGNQSKALMFVNVSAEKASAPETLCSLRFAAKVNACEIGTAKRHVS